MADLYWDDENPNDPTEHFAGRMERDLYAEREYGKRAILVPGVGTVLFAEPVEAEPPTFWHAALPVVRLADYAAFQERFEVVRSDWHSGAWTVERGRYRHREHHNGREVRRFRHWWSWWSAPVRWRVDRGLLVSWEATLGRRRPKAVDVARLAIVFHSLEGNSAGGNLHIVLDDPNYGDGSVLFCLNEAREEDDGPGTHLAQVLLLMTRRQRRWVSDLVGRTPDKPVEEVVYWDAVEDWYERSGRRAFP